MGIKRLSTLITIAVVIHRLLRVLACLRLFRWYKVRSATGDVIVRAEDVCCVVHPGTETVKVDGVNVFVANSREIGRVLREMRVRVLLRNLSRALFAWNLQLDENEIELEENKDDTRSRIEQVEVKDDRQIERLQVSSRGIPARQLDLEVKVDDDQSMHDEEFVNVPEILNLQVFKKPNSEEQAQYDIFLCYSGEAKIYAIQIYLFLSVLQFRVWIDKICIRTELRNQTRIAEGLASCSKLLILVDPSYFKKKWPQIESRSWLTYNGLVGILPLFYNITTDECRGKGVLVGGKPIGDILRSISGVPPFLGWNKAEWMTQIAVSLDSRIAQLGTLTDLFIAVCHEMKTLNIVYSETDSGRADFKINEAGVTKANLIRARETLCAMYEFSCRIKIEEQTPKYDKPVFSIASPVVSRENFADADMNHLKRVVDHFLDQFSLSLAQSLKELHDFNEKEIQKLVELTAVRIRKKIRVRDVSYGSVIASLSFPMMSLEEKMFIESKQKFVSVFISPLDFVEHIFRLGASKFSFLIGSNTYTLVNVDSLEENFDHHEVDFSQIDVNSMSLTDFRNPSCIYFDSNLGIIKPINFGRKSEHKFDIYISCDTPLSTISFQIILYLHCMGFKVCLNRFNGNASNPADIINGLRDSKFFLFICSSRTFSLEGGQALSQWELATWTVNNKQSNLKVLFDSVDSEKCYKMGYYMSHEQTELKKRVGTCLVDLHEENYLEFISSQIDLHSSQLNNQLNFSLISKLIYLFSGSALNEKYMRKCFFKTREVIQSIQFRVRSLDENVQKACKVLDQLDFCFIFDVIIRDFSVDRSSDIKAVVLNRIASILDVPISSFDVRIPFQDSLKYESSEKNEFLFQSQAVFTLIKMRENGFTFSEIISALSVESKETNEIASDIHFLDLFGSTFHFDVNFNQSYSVKANFEKRMDFLVVKMQYIGESFYVNIPTTAKKQELMNNNNPFLKQIDPKDIESYLAIYEIIYHAVVGTFKISSYQNSLKQPEISKKMLHISGNEAFKDGKLDLAFYQKMSQIINAALNSISFDTLIIGNLDQPTLKCSKEMIVSSLLPRILQIFKTFLSQKEIFPSFYFDVNALPGDSSESFWLIKIRISPCNSQFRLYTIPPYNESFAIGPSSIYKMNLIEQQVCKAWEDLIP